MRARGHPTSAVFPGRFRCVMRSASLVHRLHSHGALLVVGLAADRVELVGGEPVGAALVPVERDEHLTAPHDRRDPRPQPVDLAARGADPHEVTRLDAEIARSEEQTSELQSLMRISYAVFCLTQKKVKTNENNYVTV